MCKPEKATSLTRTHDISSLTGLHGTRIFHPCPVHGRNVFAWGLHRHQKTPRPSGIEDSAKAKRRKKPRCREEPGVFRLSRCSSERCQKFPHGSSTPLHCQTSSYACMPSPLLPCRKAMRLQPAKGLTPSLVLHSRRSGETTRSHRSGNLMQPMSTRA